MDSIDYAHGYCRSKAQVTYENITIFILTLTLDFGEHLPNVGPYAPSSGKLISFGDTKALTNYFEEDAHHLAALCIEPVQGWAGYV
jgi:glutamate-1-semialdehyde aminotransferase